MTGAKKVHSAQEGKQTGGDLATQERDKKTVLRHMLAKGYKTLGSQNNAMRDLPREVQN